MEGAEKYGLWCMYILIISLVIKWGFGLPNNICKIFYGEFC